MQGYGVDVGVAYFSWIDTEMVRGADRTEIGAACAPMLKGPLARTYPVSAAAEAVVRGIEQRSRIVACPRWLIALMWLRPLLPRLTERELRARTWRGSTRSPSARRSSAANERSARAASAAPGADRAEAVRARARRLSAV